MPRLNLNEPLLGAAKPETTEPIDPIELLTHTLIPKFFEVKEQADLYKADAEGLNKSIKEHMLQQGIDELTADGDLTAKVTIAKKQDFVESTLIEILKVQLKDNPAAMSAVIRTKEYVDFEALENQIYHGVVSPVDLQPAQGPIKEIVTLKVSKAKAKR